MSMAVIGCEIERRGSYAGGSEFGVTGPYERLDGRLRFAVDPAHPANREIIDLALAPHDAEGRVHFRADLCLLVPREPARGNRRLLLELPNRGRKLLPGQLNRARAENPPTANIPPGDGFLLRHGYIVGWIGWQWDVFQSDALMGLEAPDAMQEGQPIRGTNVCRFQPNFAHHTHLLADRVHQPYPAADLDEPGARLTVRDYEDGEPREIPRDQWRFARVSHGEILPDREHVYLSSGFQPGMIYELTYTTDRCPVVGTGLLAVRDAASFLHYGEAPENPLAGWVDYVYGFGMSQTGRMLRHFLYLGLNLDEEGRPAFAGLMPHVGGARRGEFNHRFAQPSVQATPGFGHRFPFADEPLDNPEGGPPEGLLDRQRANGAMPKVIYTNSSAEYWRGDCALMHVDPLGERDLQSAPQTRIYHFAGTQHGPGSLPLTRDNPNDGSRGRYGFNCVDYSPLLRAALINLDRWVSDGIEPPPNAHPRLADGTAMPETAVLDAFQAFPGIHLPDPERLPRLRQVDLGPQVDQGIGRYPVVEGAAYPALVAAVDADGNELGGIRLPDLTVPLGTFTGWNPRDPETGSPEQILPMQGATFFFQPTRATREAAGDPRPSLEERYAGRTDYLLQVREAAQRLVSDGYALPEDVEIMVQNAAERWDAAVVSG